MWPPTISADHHRGGQGDDEPGPPLVPAVFLTEIDMAMLPMLERMRVHGWSPLPGTARTDVDIGCAGAAAHDRRDGQDPRRAPVAPAGGNADIRRMDAPNPSATPTFASRTPLHIGAIGLKVRDLDRLTDYYRDVLGLSVLDRSRDERHARCRRGRARPSRAPAARQA